MKNLFFLCLVLSLSLLVSCENSGESNSGEAETTETDTLVNEQSTNSLPLTTLIRAKYVSAAVYAAATEYTFVQDDGQQITIRVSAEEGAVNPEVPEALLAMEKGEDGEESEEGPPMANPDMVGKYMTIERDPSGNYTKVIYSTGKKQE